MQLFNQNKKKYLKKISTYSKYYIGNSFPCARNACAVSLYIELSPKEHQCNKKISQSAVTALF